jgi:hypothetical protein
MQFSNISISRSSSYFYTGLLAVHRELRWCVRSYRCNPGCYLPLLDPAGSLRIADILSHLVIIFTSQLHFGRLHRKVPIPGQTHPPMMSLSRTMRQRGKRRYRPRGGISSAGKPRMAPESVVR